MRLIRHTSDNSAERASPEELPSMAVRVELTEPLPDSVRAGKDEAADDSTVSLQKTSDVPKRVELIGNCSFILRSLSKG